MRLGGGAALVVGGTSGIGAATARRLRTEGCEVVVTGRDVAKGDRVASESGLHFRQADVLDTDAVIAAVEHAAGLAPLRVLVHCAGAGIARRTVGRDGTYHSAHPLGAFQQVVDDNLVGTFNVVRLAATAVGRTDPDEQGQRGAIVIASSLAARCGQVGQAAYAAAKAGQLGMILPLARDLAPLGIRVNAITPGGIDTPIYGDQGAPGELRRKVADAAVFPKRMGLPDEFASLALELLRNDYLNGVAIDLAGGTVQLPR